MKGSTIATLLLAHTAYAQYTQLLLPTREDLSPREFGDDICVIGSTCEECFGEGYIICDKIGCFNPDKHQQCCKNALLCTSKSDDCCDELGGTGVVGTTGAPVRPTTTIQPTSTDLGWTCTRDEDPEDCCQKGGEFTHWCSGEFPSALCFHEKLQRCCTDGTVCDDPDCCEELFDLSTTKPWLAGKAEETGKPTATSSDANEAAATTTEDGPESTTEDEEDGEDAASLVKIDNVLVKLSLSVLGVVVFLGL